MVTTMEYPALSNIYYYFVVVCLETYLEWYFFFLDFQKNLILNKLKLIVKNARN